MITEWSRDGPEDDGCEKKHPQCLCTADVDVDVSCNQIIGLCVPDVDDVRLFRDVDGVRVQHSQPVFL